MVLSAEEFLTQIKLHASAEAMQKYEKTFKESIPSKDIFIGVRMGTVFALAKDYMSMPLEEVEKLLESEIHEVRVGAVSILDFQARNKKTTDTQRKKLYDLYMRRHDRINTWDLVDRSAIYVVGGYLFNKPHDVLFSLAHSKHPMERRTAIVSTAYFIKNNTVDDTFKIAEILVADEHELVQKATGWMLRFAGDKDQKRLLHFLDTHAAKMPRAMLRYSIEKLSNDQRKQYLEAVKVQAV